MLKHCPRLVPWTGWDEWSQVREWLYTTDDSESCRRGLRRIEAWRARGRVPVSVDATAALVEASLAYAERRAGGGAHAPGAGPSETSVRLGFAMALIRFVNGLVDTGQRGAVARSVVTIAAELGLPTWFVELRHEATHNALPTLACLRLAGEHALSWLHVNYWSVQQAQLPAARAAVVAALRDYGARSLALLREADEAEHALDAAAAERAVSPGSSAAAAAAPTPEKGARRRLRAGVRTGLAALAVSVSSQLSKSVPPNAVHSMLVGALLDDGLLAPAAADAHAPRLAPTPAAFSADRLLERWSPLLRAAHKVWPHFGLALIIATAERLAGAADAGAGAEAAPVVVGAEAAVPGARGERGGGGGGDARTPKRRRTADGSGGAGAAASPPAASAESVPCAGRQGTLQAWLLHFLDPSAQDSDGGATGALALYDDTSAEGERPARRGGRCGEEPRRTPPRSLLLGLLQLLLESPLHNEWARDVVTHLLRLLHFGASSAVATRVAALLAAREGADAARRGGAPLAARLAALPAREQPLLSLDRLAALSQLAAEAVAARSAPAAEVERVESAAATLVGAEPAGPWRMVQPSRPCPIGCALDGSVPQLDAVAPFVTWLVQTRRFESEEEQLQADQ
jgi:hypothetical protein